MSDVDLDDIEEDEEETFLERCGYNAGVFIGSVGIILLLGSIVVAGALVHGFTIMVLWEWFLTPLGLPALGLAHATGLGFFSRYMTWNHVQPSKDEKEDLDNRIGRAVALAFVYPFLILGLAWICHTFM